MPDYGYAILSALLWAISAPVINRGLHNLPQQSRPQWISLGLLFAMLSGTAVLSPFLLTIETHVQVNIYLILSGICTFPLATGTYYLSGAAFSGRTEFASQFSKIKPLLSFVFATVILHEAVTNMSYFSVALIALGTIIFIWGARSHSLSRKGVVLGLLTALFWALGELFMKLGVSDNNPILANYVALVSGILVFAVYLMATWRNANVKGDDFIRLWPFLMHGVISFGAAYSFFFYSVKQIGLAQTVLINAFWPILSIIITSMIRMARNRPVEIPKILLLGSVVLLFGSLVQAFAYM